MYYSVTQSQYSSEYCNLVKLKSSDRISNTKKHTPRTISDFIGINISLAYNNNVNIIIICP